MLEIWNKLWTKEMGTSKHLFFLKKIASGAFGLLFFLHRSNISKFIHLDLESRHLFFQNFACSAFQLYLFSQADRICLKFSLSWRIFFFFFPVVFCNFLSSYIGSKLQLISRIQFALDFWNDMKYISRITRWRNTYYIGSSSYHQQVIG